MYSYEDNFATTFNTFGLLFIITSIFITCVFIGIIVTMIIRWNKNNNSPRLIVDATVVSKRAHRSSGSHTGNMHTSGTTTYYVTFQVESGDRMELHMTGQEYGMLVEGDHGKLTFQGTRYLGFAREF